jgi:putative membrane protein insertion efficiency factor
MNSMPHSASYARANSTPSITPGVRAALVAVRAYQLLLAPFAGGACRFHPTCSAYALEALTEHGVWRGGRLALARVAKCHPFGPSGIDAVPPSSR